MSYANMDAVPTQTAGTSELLASDWNTYVRDNFDSIKFGHVVCTSGSRPTGIAEGTMIYETDTQKVLVYSGASWVEISDLDNSGAASDGVNAFLTRRIFTTEAARDAAITSPVEGQEAYLTAPTIPAAVSGTGGTTIVPTGVTTIYNGSAWVCTTPVGVFNGGSSNTVTSSSYTDATWGGTAMTVTAETGTTAMVSLTARMFAPTGAFFFAAVKPPNANSADTYAISAQSDGGSNTPLFGGTFIFTGLTAGSNTFKIQLRNNGAANGKLDSTHLIVRGIA